VQKSPLLIDHIPPSMLDVIGAIVNGMIARRIGVSK
jgi:hypothetical protein